MNIWSPYQGNPFGADKSLQISRAVFLIKGHKVRKRAKIRNRYNQAPHLTQDTNGIVTTSQLDITNESQEVSPFPAGDHKASPYKSGYLIFFMPGSFGFKLSKIKRCKSTTPIS